MELLVRKSRVDAQTALVYELTARDHELGLHHREFGPVRFTVDPGKYFTELFREIDSLPPADVDTRVDVMNAKGASLARDLLPERLSRTLWQLRDKVGYLQVVSDEGWIPWEMLRIGGRLADGRMAEDYLCAAYSLTRWRRGLPQHLHLPLQKVALVVTRGADLPAVAAECSALTALFARCDRIEPTYRQVTEHMAAADHDGWHFSGHGFAGSSDPNHWSIGLDDFELTPESLHGRAADLARKRPPLVFLNACHTGKGGQSLTDVGGWAARLLDLKVGAFLGASWTANDEAAAAFSEAFYRGFLGGLAIGEAVRGARLYIRDAFPGDPTWLAYTIFAHPEAICREGDAQEEPAAAPATAVEPITVAPLVTGALTSRRASWVSLALLGLTAVILVLVTMTGTDRADPTESVEAAALGNGSPSLDAEPSQPLTEQISTDDHAVGSGAASRLGQDQTMPTSRIAPQLPPSSSPPIALPPEKPPPPPPQPTAEPIVPGKIGIAVIDEPSGTWDSRSASLMVAQLSKSVAGSRPIILTSKVLPHIDQLLLDDLTSLPGGGRSPQGVEFLLLAVSEQEFTPGPGSNIVNVRQTLDFHVIQMETGTIAYREISTHMGQGESKKIALKQAIGRCLLGAAAALQDGQT